MAILEEARAAKAKAKQMYPDAVVGLCGADGGGYAVKIGLPGGTTLQAAPGDIDGVPVRFEVIGRVRPRITAEKFRQFGSARVLEWRELESVAAALEDGERMRRMVEAMAEDYETYCPLCGEGEDTPAHLGGCDFGKFLDERRDGRGVTCQDQ